jgi:orotate phosphoribosyltransferase
MIAKALLETGILQFGYFVDNENISPYRLRLEILPAYPALMQQILYLLVQALPAGDYDRLVAHSDAIPLGTALALHTGIPLVYSRGKGESAAYDLVGAYDVGHPALLIVNSIQPEMNTLIKQCRGVGLEISAGLELVSLGKSIEGVPAHSLTSLKALIHELRLNKAIPEKQAEAVLNTMG